MLNRLLGFLDRTNGAAASTASEADFSRCQVAAAALLVESCRIDANFDRSEQDRIRRIVSERFDLSREDAAELVKIAEKRQSEVYSDWLFTEAVKKDFSSDECAQVVGMLWEAAYSDGQLHKFESHMINRVAGEIGVSPEIMETERQDALSRLKMKDPGKPE